MQTISSFTRLLAPGQTLHLHLRRGACVLTVEGSPRVFRQIWLAGRMVSLPVYAAGDALYEADATGWIQIEAPLRGVAVRFEVIEAPGLRQRWAALRRRNASVELDGAVAVLPAV